MQVQELMTHRVQSIRADASVKDAAYMMQEAEVGSLLVVEDGILVGIVTDRDVCCKVVAQGRDASATKVWEVMAEDVVTCFTEEDVFEAAQIMEGHHVRRLAVLDYDMNTAGILSVDDLARGNHDLAGAVLEAATPIH